MFDFFDSQRCYGKIYQINSSKAKSKYLDTPTHLRQLTIIYRGFFFISSFRMLFRYISKSQSNISISIGKQRIILYTLAIKLTFNRGGVIVGIRPE